MPTWRLLSRKAPPKASSYFRGLDTNNLYIRDARGYYICVAGLPADVGCVFTKAYVESGRGIVSLPSGTYLELII